MSSSAPSHRGKHSTAPGQSHKGCDCHVFGAAQCSVIFLVCARFYVYNICMYIYIYTYMYSLYTHDFHDIHYFFLGPALQSQKCWRLVCIWLYSRPGIVGAQQIICVAMSYTIEKHVFHPPLQCFNHEQIPVFQSSEVTSNHRKSSQIPMFSMDFHGEVTSNPRFFPQLTHKRRPPGRAFPASHLDVGIRVAHCAAVVGYRVGHALGAAGHALHAAQLVAGLAWGAQTGSFGELFGGGEVACKPMGKV